jgi:hypothetical protein
MMGAEGWMRSGGMRAKDVVEQKPRFWIMSFDCAARCAGLRTPRRGAFAYVGAQHSHSATLRGTMCCAPTTQDIQLG